MKNEMGISTGVGIALIIIVAAIVGGVVYWATRPGPAPGATVLAVATTPVNGEVFVNGVSWGTAPVTKTVDPGSYEITFGTVSGYTTPASKTVTLASGQTKTVTGTYTSITPTIKVGTPFTTPIEEPWDGVIHKALLKAENELGIKYTWTDDVGYADLPSVLREWAPKYDIVFSDTFGCEESARVAAGDFPNTQFVMGSGLGPTDPNVSVFDDWIHEPAYLCGMMAGELTETNIIGVVGGVPIPEVNRLINAFKAGAKEVNPDVKVKIAFLGEWFNPTKAKELALAQIDAGADVLYAERYGVHEAALEKLETEGKVIPLFGNLLDQYELAPELVVTGPLWDMYPTVKYVIEQYKETGKPIAIDLAGWSMMAKGGAKLAPWHDWQTRLHPSIVAKINQPVTYGGTTYSTLIDMVEAIKAEIIAGTFRAPVAEETPVSD